MPFNRWIHHFRTWRWRKTRKTNLISFEKSMCCNRYTYFRGKWYEILSKNSPFFNKENVYSRRTGKRMNEQNEEEKNNMKMSFTCKLSNALTFRAQCVSEMKNNMNKKRERKIEKEIELIKLWTWSIAICAPPEIKCIFHSISPSFHFFFCVCVFIDVAIKLIFTHSIVVFCHI